MLVGLNTGDDAAVVRLAPDLGLVLTVDFFTPIVDDPYDYGRIAAANSLSDVYAMGGEPVAALSIVSFPSKSQPLAVLGAMLRGAADVATQAGIAIVGGHSVEDPEPKFGLAVAGVVHPDRILKNQGAAPGDVLFLTKPLGSGVLTTALRRGLLDDDALAEVTRVMATLNADAGKAAVEAGASACTDITGFGLLGHLGEMLAGTGCGAALSVSALPRMTQVADLVRDGVSPAGTQRNLDHFGARLHLGAGVRDETRLLLADPQTSGGLLIAVPADRRAQLAARLHALAVESWAEIGRITEDDQENIAVGL